MEIDFWNVCGVLALCYGLGAAVLLLFVQLGFIELCLAALLRRACRRLSAGSPSQQIGALSVTHDKRGPSNVFISTGLSSMSIESISQGPCFALCAWWPSHPAIPCFSEHIYMPAYVFPLQVFAFCVSPWARKRCTGTARVHST